MNNSHYFKSIFQMQYVRRWQEFSPRHQDNAASHSFRCAAIAVLISIIEQRLLMKAISPAELIGKALLHDLNETVTGSIKYVTKKEKTLISHIQRLEGEVNQQLVSHLSKSLQYSFTQYIVQAEDASYTGGLVRDIDSFDAMLFCKRESELQKGGYFTARYKELRSQLLSSSYDSIRWLLHALEQDQGIAQFLHYILNLDMIERWGGSFNLIPDNDATHSFRVAAIALFHAHLEKEKYKIEHINLYSLLGKSIMHDVVEGVSGDVASPIKQSSAEIKEAFAQFEAQVARDMVNELPSFMIEDMMDFLVYAKDDTYEGLLVDIADKIDALIKSNLEMRNNPHYASKYEQQLTHIQHRYENPSVIFFLAYILHDLTFDQVMR